MARTKIYKMKDRNIVVMERNDEFGNPRRDEFVVIGGKVHRYVGRFGQTEQVCDGLDSRGWALEARDDEDLLEIIRRQWRTVRAAQRKAEREYA